jgi:hypothetical protein
MTGTGARLGRRDVGIGHEVHVGSRHAGRVGSEDDGAVHLGQLRKPLGRELGVEEEAARAHVQHLGAVADDDHRPHAGLEDAVEALSQRRPRRHQAQGVEHRFCPWLRGHAGSSKVSNGHRPPVREDNDTNNGIGRVWGSATRVDAPAGVAGDGAPHPG